MEKTRRPHHYYWCMADGLVGMKLKEFTERCNVASEQAREWAEKQGADEYIESPDGMAGGIAALIFEQTPQPPLGGESQLERVQTPHGDVYYLPTPDSEMEKEMYALPVVSEMELIGLLDFEPVRNKQGVPMPFSFGDRTPVLFCDAGCWYIDIPYKSNALGMIEMGEAEFEILLKEKVK